MSTKCDMMMSRVFVVLLFLVICSRTTLAEKPTPANLVLSPSELEFSSLLGAFVEAGTSVTSYVTLRNTGKSPATNIVIGVPTSELFRRNDTYNNKPCSAKLAGGASCILGVQFSPTQAGTFSGEIPVSYSGLKVPLTLALWGKSVLQLKSPIGTTWNFIAGKESYSKLSAVGCVGSCPFVLSSGSLPPGLSINSLTGSISGTVPESSVGSVYSFSISITDSLGFSSEMVLAVSSSTARRGEGKISHAQGTAQRRDCCKTLYIQVQEWGPELEVQGIRASSNNES